MSEITWNVNPESKPTFGPFAHSIYKYNDQIQAQPTILRETHDARPRKKDKKAPHKLEKGKRRKTCTMKSIEKVRYQKIK